SLPRHRLLPTQLCIRVPTPLLNRVLPAPWRRHSCLPGRDSSRLSSSHIDQAPRRVSARQTKSLRHNSLDALCVRAVLFALFSIAGAVAQTPYDVQLRPAAVAHEIPINRGSTALWQSLKKLHTRASLIMITAHPDDE